MSTDAGSVRGGELTRGDPAPTILLRPWSLAMRALLTVLVLAFAVGLQVTSRAWQRGPQRSTRLAILLRVNPNTVPPHVLEALPHVGPAMAGRIAAERDVRAFDSIADLRRVRGLGPATMARLSRHLVIREGARSASPTPPTVAVQAKIPGVRHSR